jgi:hypothetical protein
MKAHRFAFSLSGSILQHLEGSVWLFRVAELFGYGFQTIGSFADECFSFRGVSDPRSEFWPAFRATQVSDD